MITLVEALNFRCLRYVQRPLKRFHVLVGPNASGKSTFLDVIGFLSDLVNDGLDAALANRSSNPEDLLYRQQGHVLQLAVEARIPKSLRALTLRPELDAARYELALGNEENERQFEIKAERLLLKTATAWTPPQRSLFPMLHAAPPSLLSNSRKRDNKIVINKVPNGNDNFYSEVYLRSGRGWTPSFKLGSRRSALGNLLADEKAFPVATWFQEYLKTGVQRFALNSSAIRQPSPPLRIDGFLPDGSNLPWVVARLQNEDPERYQAWLAHLRTVLRDLEAVTTFERPEDRYRFMLYTYKGGLQLPSWMVSDGTLRLTALTLIAYAAHLERPASMYLIEEPENGVHPGAVRATFDSLSSVYESQVLLATHSTMLLNEAQLDDVLCFAKSDGGATDIVLGSEHPRLSQWRNEIDLGTLLASGVLG